jgi:serine/threonine-protein kinase RsbW
MSELDDYAALDDVLVGAGLPLDVRIPSDLRYIEQVVGVVARGCAKLAFPPRAYNLQVPVALTEAIANAILYGNREDATKGVRVRAAVSERALVMEVSDEGSGFDFATCFHDPTDPEQLESEAGRGLFLMTRLMDRVECFTDGGQVVRLTLHRP